MKEVLEPREDSGAAREISIELNGETRHVAAGATVSALLESLNRHPRTVAVEYNGEILRRELFGSTRLAAGDRVEVVHFVQGG